MNERTRRVIVGGAGWLSGPMPNPTLTDTPAMRAVVEPDADLIEIVDGSGPLLSMSFDEARIIADQIRDLLVIFAPDPA